MFVLGGQCGLKPDELLDMSLDTFNCYTRGYSNRLVDYQALAIQTGYWAAYYSNAKRPRPVRSIIQSLIQKKHQLNTTDSNTPSVLSQEELASFIEKENRIMAGEYIGERR